MVLAVLLLLCVCLVGLWWNLWQQARQTSDEARVLSPELPAQAISNDVSQTTQINVVPTQIPATSPVAVPVDPKLVTVRDDAKKPAVLTKAELERRQAVEQLFQRVSATPPSWAPGGVKRDQYGAYADLVVGTVTQRMRLITPGTFAMGDMGATRAVTISKAFWLADSECTQALWTAVSGTNPSHFKGDQKPVENVSWDDVQRMLTKLNGRVANFRARLPTEAEWEYACRAGTTTEFSFGDTITTDQVNYDGNYPMEGSAKGLFRETTVPVKTLPMNAWGLYEMHGNAWEWCSDWYGPYPAGAVSNPTGPIAGSDRLIRGGSWGHGSGTCRSAFRIGATPDIRSGYIGFRLCAHVRDEINNSEALSQSLFEREQLIQRVSATPPSWAPGGVKRDQHGAYADLVVTVTQRMRLIVPGMFAMNYKGATHAVTINKPFWLADSECTQTLWTAVTGTNPSHFKGDQKPVENVSWDDVQGMLTKLNGRVANLQARLPTAAEWEYACRAGTTTVFSFGDTITTDQVNYDGNRPMEGSAKDMYRETTVLVKSLPINAWGLHEMHGNVGEWCSDWEGDYPPGVIGDPNDRYAYAHRVIRGGSCFSSALLCRSGFYYGFPPKYRDLSIGFRLCAPVSIP